MYLCDNPKCESYKNQSTRDNASYHGYNSTYGYCDKTGCKKACNSALGDDITELVGLGDLDLAEELIGDGDIMEFI